MKKVLLVVSVVILCSINTKAQSVMELTNAANSGDIEAAYKLGCMYFSGEGAYLDKTLATTWWEKAANSGHIYAMERLAVCYQNGYGVSKDKEKCKYWYDKGAESGNAFCQYQVGKNYLIGLRGYARDSIKAEYFLLASVTNNFPDDRVFGRACRDLSMLYSDALPNKDKAFYWLKKAADAPHGELECVRLGEKFLQGDIPSVVWHPQPDYQQAFLYFSKAAKLGYNDGFYWVGQCYLNAWGVQQDCDSALYYFNKAALANSNSACWALGKIYLGKGACAANDINEKQALFWYGKATDYSVEALIDLGTYYKKVNFSKSFEYFNLAVDKYNESLELHKKFPKQSIVSDDGLKHISWCYIFGKGVEQDLPKAYSYLNRYLHYHPDDFEGFLFLGDYFMVKNQKDSASVMMNKVLSMAPEEVVKDEELYKYVFNIKGGASRDKHLAISKQSDVDMNIPIGTTSNNKTFVVVIANEDYEEVANVPYALNDGNTFAMYCQKTLAIPEQNIHFIKNATLNKLKREIDWLVQIMNAYNGDASAIFYYAGHGIPDEKNKDAFLLPVDGYGNDVNTGYKVSTLYQTLGSMNSKRTTIFMDACFSGAKREGDMLVSARGVAIKANPSTPQGNMIVFSAATGDETAYPNNQEGHGMFTYYLLKKIQETKGDVTYDELGNYIKQNVSQQSIVLNGKSQTPTIIASPTVIDWQNWKLK